MEIKGIPITRTYLESLPLNKITKYSQGRQKDAIPFIGYPKQHPTDKTKIILIHDPMGASPAVLEFKLDDVLYIEEVSQAVTEQGEGIPMIKLWVRRGAHGMFLEPFEVGENIRFKEAGREVRERFSRQA
jgi:inorganic pyrophosphatase